MKSTRWVLSYVVAASIGLWFALFLSLKFLAPARSETIPGPPAAGDLPPEFSNAAQGSGTIPPPPSGPPSVPGQMAPPAPPSAPPVPAQLGGGRHDVAPSPPTAPGVPAGMPVDVQVPPQTPQFATDDQYTYDPTGRRDPFKPYRHFKPGPVTGGAAVKAVDLSDPLQRFDLARFDVVAIMWEIRNPRAMVRDPDGKLYMIAKSTKIGRNSGQVVAIREGEVVVVETIDNEGVVAKEVKVLELKK